jgi:HemY protein
MLGILKLLVLAILAACAAWGVAALPGRLSGDIGGYTIETTARMAVLAFVIVLVVCTVAIRLLGAALRLPGLGARWRAERRRSGGDLAITRTLVAIAAGAGNDARREAHKARRLLGDTPQTLLLAAEAARLAEHDDEAEIAFRALTAREDAALLGYRGLFRLAVAREDWPEAAVLAARAEQAHPGANWLRPERSRLAVRSGNWAGALELAPRGPARAARAVAAARAETDPNKAAVLAKQAWRLDPALTPAALAYAQLLRETGKERTAQSVVRHAWTVAPHPDLGAFALLPLTDPLERARAAQRLTGANPDHPESRLLLARTDLEAGLVGEARHQAEAAQAAGLHQRRLFLLLAEIAEAEGHDPAAGRAALRLATEADADSAWHCESCHAVFPTWHGACPTCSTPGSLRWKAA